MRILDSIYHQKRGISMMLFSIYHKIHCVSTIYLELLEGHINRPAIHK